MDALIETFHIDWKLVIAQLINFIIVLTVLYFFALKPITKIMRDRSKKVEKSLEQAKEIEVRLSETEENKERVINRAKKEALSVLENSKKQAKSDKDVFLIKTKKEVETIIIAGKEKLAQEKEKMIQEVKEEMADLVVESAKKIVGGENIKNIDKDMVIKTVKSIKK